MLNYFKITKHLPLRLGERGHPSGFTCFPFCYETQRLRMSLDIAGKVKRILMLSFHQFPFISGLQNNFLGDILLFLRPFRPIKVKQNVERERRFIRISFHLLFVHISKRNFSFHSWSQKLAIKPRRLQHLLETVK